MSNKRIISGIILFILILNCTSTLAQSYYLLGGVNASKLGQPKDDVSSEVSRSIKPGFQLGPSVDFNINNHFSINPGLFFSFNREYIEAVTVLETPGVPFNDNIIMQANTSAKEFYVDLPVNLKLKYSFANIDIFCLAGPYINLLLFDKTSAMVLMDGNLVPELEESGDEKFINRIDYGANFGLGLEFKSFLIQVSYDYGLYRKMRYNNFEDNNLYRNMVFRLGLGYKL